MKGKQAYLKAYKMVDEFHLTRGLKKNHEARSFGTLSFARKGWPSLIQNKDTSSSSQYINTITSTLFTLSIEIIKNVERPMAEIKDSRKLRDHIKNFISARDKLKEALNEYNDPINKQSKINIDYNKTKKLITAECYKLFIDDSNNRISLPKERPKSSGNKRTLLISAMEKGHFVKKAKKSIRRYTLRESKSQSDKLLSSVLTSFKIIPSIRSNI